jgi:hypothetical protein
VACQNNHVNNVEIVYFALLIASNITVLFEIKSYVCMCKWVFENATGNRQKQKYRRTGTDVVILKLFSPKNLAKILAFFAQTTAKIAENCDHTIDPWSRKQPMNFRVLSSNRKRVLLRFSTFDVCG